MHKNYLPEIQQSQSVNHFDAKAKQKLHSPNSSIEWEQLINTSIPNSVKAQFIPKAQTSINLSKIGPTSDISYLRSTKRNFAKLGTSIYKEPELQQTKYDKNLQSFYSTLYRKSSVRVPFNTNLEKERFSGHLLDFTEIFQDNKKATGLQKYFGEILKLEMQQSSQEKEMIPPNRQQAIDLRDWLFMMIAYTKQESSNMNTRDLAERIQLIYASCLRELIKQVSIECSERGELMQTVWDFYVELIGQIIKCFSEQQKESEKSYIEQMQRIQNFHDSQIEVSSQRYKEYEESIQKIKNETQDQVDELNMTKAKMLLLTADLRQLLEVNEAQKKEIDALLLQIMLIRTQEAVNSDGKKVDDEKINVKLSQGKSIVSHLLNFKAPAQEYKFNKSKVKNNNFEKFEQLRQQELQLKSELIDQQILEPDIEFADQEIQASCEFFHQEVQTDMDLEQLNQLEQKLEQQDQQIQELQQQQENQAQEIQNQQQQFEQELCDKKEKQNQEQLLLEERLKEAIQLIQNSEIDAKDAICETLSQTIQQNQQLSQRIIRLESMDTTQRVQIMEQTDVNQELESKLTQAVQDFIEIIKQKKSQIKKLVKQKTNLQDTLKQIQNTYNIEINQPEIIEEEKDSSQFKSIDQSSEMRKDFDNTMDMKEQQEQELIDEQEELDYQQTDRSMKKVYEEDSRAAKQLKIITQTNENYDSQYLQTNNKRNSTLDNESVEKSSVEQSFQDDPEQSSIKDDNLIMSKSPRKTKEDKKVVKIPIDLSKTQASSQPSQGNQQKSFRKQQKQSVTQQAQQSQFQPNQQQKREASNSESRKQQNNESNISADQKVLSKTSQNSKIREERASKTQNIQDFQQNQQQPNNVQTVSKKQQLVQDKQLTLQLKQAPQKEKQSILDTNQSSMNKSTQEQEEQQQNQAANYFQQKQQIHYDKSKNLRRNNTNERQVNSSQNDELTPSDDVDFDQTPTNNPQQAERVKQIVSQYKDQKHKIRGRYNPVLLEPKNQKRFRRVYSQNTDVANGLLNEVKSKKKQNKKVQFSILQLQKLITQILGDICKQTEGYKIPFHVSIYDYYKNKYGFKQVAEKKIRQVYQFIYYEKDSHIKAKLLAQFCYMIGEMDEIGQKLLTESFQFISGKNDLNYSKVDLQLNYEQMSEFLTEKSSVWLQQQQIQQLLQFYRAQQQGNQRYYINLDSLLQKILDFYTNNKKDQQTILESLFQAADLDGNKLIEFSEFKTLYRAIHQEKLVKSQLLQIFTNNADFQDENGDKYLTLPRFTEMSIELGIFQKELVLKYREGSQDLTQFWERDKDNIKYRFLKAKKFSKVRHTFQELENQIKIQEKDKQVILWVSYKLLNEDSQRVILNYETKQCLFSLLPELYLIEQQSKAIEQLE